MDSIKFGMGQDTAIYVSSDVSHYFCKYSKINSSFVKSAHAGFWPGSDPH